MNQTENLHSSLKAALKQQGKTYRDVSLCLGLSEASIKRLFASAGFTLKRIEQICEWLGLDIVSLVEQMEQQRQKLQQLTPQQEQQLVDDPLMLLVAISVLNSWQFDEILSYYQISAPALIQKLAALDRMALIELLPGNRIKLMVSSNFRWQAHGPIQRYFRARVEQEFFQHEFNDDGSVLRCLNGMLGNDALTLVKQELEKLALKFEQVNQGEKKLPVAERHGTTLVIAMRRWQFSAFAEYRK